MGVLEPVRVLARDERGAVAVVTALFLVALFACGALAVDAGFAVSRRAELQTVADAAALAGAAFLPDTEAAVAAALEYARKNTPPGAGGPVVRSADVEVGQWNGETRTFFPGGAASAVRVRARMTHATGNAAPSFFAHVFGVDSLDIGAQAVAGRRSGGLELVMVLDVSGSMGGGGKIEALRAGAAALVDIVYGDAETGPNLWVGLVPFSGRVNIVDYGASWMQSGASSSTSSKTSTKSTTSTAKLCTGLRVQHDNDDAPPSVEAFPPFTYDDNVCPGPPVLGLTAEKSTVKKAIAALYTGHGTSTHIGMAWGWRAISPRWRGLWGNPDLPFDYRDPRVRKVVIIMTDGVNHPNQSGDPLTTAQANQQLLDECTAMKAAGIKVFTVTFQAPSEIDPLYKACASKPEYAFNSPTNAQLQVAFEEIGGLLGGRNGLLH